MKQKLLIVLALLFAMPFALAVTIVDVDFSQNTGNSYLETKTVVQGNYWDSVPIPNTATASIVTSIANNGVVSFEQNAKTFGTGHQWPSINTPGEWSMLETQSAQGTGITDYYKQLKVWTVHVPYSTEYAGIGEFNTLTQDYDYSFNGFVDSPTKTKFTQTVSTDEKFNTFSKTWINPFSI